VRLQLFKLANSSGYECIVPSHLDWAGQRVPGILVILKE